MSLQKCFCFVFTIFFGSPRVSTSAPAGSSFTTASFMWDRGKVGYMTFCSLSLTYKPTTTRMPEGEQKLTWALALQGVHCAQETMICIHRQILYRMVVVSLPTEGGLRVLRRIESQSGRSSSREGRRCQHTTGLIIEH